MTYVLDTNICIFALKGHANVVANLRQHDPNELAVSTVSLAELWFGAKKSQKPRQMRRLQDAFLAPLTVLDFTREAAEHYADIRLHLESRGAPIGERDQFIAAISRSNGRVLVTHNRREFDRIPGLAVVDWTRDEA